jgi:hypothetical protein
MGLTLIKALTASSSASLDFVDGTSSVVLDNTYNEYEFHFVNLHPATNAYYPAFKASVNGGSSYGVATTTTYVRAYHAESGATGLGYITGYDAAQSTGVITMSEDVGSDDADKSMSGKMTLYDPSSTAYVKHFTIETDAYNGGDWQAHQQVAGYVNTTSAVDAIQFLFSHGDMDAGTIYMYGVS